jgi:hypothetical protein
MAASSSWAEVGGDASIRSIRAARLEAWSNWSSLHDGDPACVRHGAPGHLLCQTTSSPPSMADGLRTAEGTEGAEVLDELLPCPC